MALGAATGAFFISLSSPLFIHLLIITIASLAASLFARFHLIQDKPQVETDGPAFQLPSSALIGIGVIAFCSMLGEGAMADWSTNYMEKIVMAPKTLAPLGLSAFALAMTIGRIFGDSARSKYGDKTLMIACGIVATLGLIISIVMIQPIVVMLGFFLVGAGLSVIVPIAYSIAGNSPGISPGVGLAMVTTVGYAGFLFGPPIIGFLADWQTLRLALLFVVILFLLMTLLSYRYKSNR
jgi:MFS family permease